VPGQHAESFAAPGGKFVKISKIAPISRCSALRWRALGYEAGCPRTGPGARHALSYTSVPFFGISGS